MRNFGSLGLRLAIALLLASLLLPSFSQAQDDYEDPPSRVARLSFIRGPVSFQPAGTDDWIDAAWNRTLTTGDALWTDQGARAALHIGSASIVLSENTGFSFLNLNDNVAQMQLSSGTLRLRVKRLADNENFEVDTPNLAFSVLRPGIYEIKVNEDGNTTVIEDRAGEGEVTGGGSAFTVHAGELDTFSGTDQLYADTDSIYDNGDEFEEWCELRDHHEDNSISIRYVSDDVIGYDDLDDNGGWRSTPDFGYIWFPHTTIVGWAPYHYGHWDYVAPWGYTWVDDAQWGFAPFHYGRWIFVNGAWGWVPVPPRPAVYSPGVVYVRPVYAPALVAWVGIGGSSVGWFPLGPREVYVPSYPVSRNYVTNVNISNTTVNTTVINNYYTTVVVNKTVNVTNVTYVNQRVQGAVVATSSQAFSSGQPVARNVIAVNVREVASAPVVAMTPPTVPQREAVLGGRPTANVKPPAAVQARAIVAKTPPPPRPPSFAQRQAAIQANGGRPLSAAQVRQIAPARTQAAVVRVKVAPPAKPAQMRVASNNRAAGNNNVNRPPEPTPTPAQPAANNNRPPANAAISSNNAAHPPTARPVNEQLEQQHQQQNADLHAKQDAERQQLEQQQEQERQKSQQQQADEARRQQAAQQLAQQHQQQLEQLQQKHQQEQKQLQQQQEQEHKDAEKKQSPPPKPDNKRDEKKPQ